MIYIYKTWQITWGYRLRLRLIMKVRLCSSSTSERWSNYLKYISVSFYVTQRKGVNKNIWKTQTFDFDPPLPHNLEYFFCINVIDHVAFLYFVAGCSKNFLYNWDLKDNLSKGEKEKVLKSLGQELILSDTVWPSLSLCWNIEG